MTFNVIELVTNHDLAILIDGYSVLRIGKILGRKPIQSEGQRPSSHRAAEP